MKIYQEELEDIEPLISGEDLKKWGMQPGPQLGDRLEKLFLKQLDMKNPSRDKLKEHLQYKYPDLEVS